jgi:hypothetical protein
MKAATLSILSDGSVGIVPAHLINDEIFALSRKIFHCANNNLWRFFLLSYLNDTSIPKETTLSTLYWPIVIADWHFDEKYNNNPRKIFHYANNNLWRVFLLSYLNDTQRDHTFYLVLTNSYSWLTLWWKI